MTRFESREPKEIFVDGEVVFIPYHRLPSLTKNVVLPYFSFGCYKEALDLLSDMHGQRERLNTQNIKATEGNTISVKN